jgi:hypothetical protein
MKDYYYILGVKHDAPMEDIKTAYRKLAAKFHPDKNNQDDFFSERFKEIQEAWEILGSIERRFTYDKLRSANTSSTASGNKRSRHLFEYLDDNKSKINNIAMKVGTALAVIYYAIHGSLGYVLDCLYKGTYEPLKLKSLMVQMGGDWALFVDWVYNPQVFVIINTLIGWVFKIVLFVPVPLVMIGILYFYFMIVIAAALWLVKLAANYLGTIGGLVIAALACMLLIGMLL